MKLLDILCPLFFGLGLIDWAFAAYTWVRPERVKAFEKNFNKIYMDDDWLPKMLDALQEDFLRVIEELGPYSQELLDKGSDSFREVFRRFFDMDTPAKLVVFYVIAFVSDAALMVGGVIVWLNGDNHWWAALFVFPFIVGAIYAAVTVAGEIPIFNYSIPTAAGQFALSMALISGWVPFFPFVILVAITLGLYFILVMLAAYLVLMLGVLSIFPAAVLLMAVVLIARELHFVARKREEGVVSAALFFAGGIGLVVGSLCEFLRG